MEHAQAQQDAAARELAQVEGVLGHPQLLATTMYLAVLALMLINRSHFFTLVNPRPPAMVRNVEGRDGPDLWMTNDLYNFVVMGLWFTLVSLLHLYVVAILLLKRPPTMPRMHRGIGWLLPSALFLLSTIAFISYGKMSRYGTSTAEWSAVAVFCIVLFAFTIALLLRGQSSCERLF